MTKWVGALLLMTVLGSISHGESSAVTSFDIRDFGAKPGGEVKCTAAFQKAIAAAEHRGGGTVYVPGGNYLTGPIELKSDITLYLDAGAVLKFSDDFDDYLPMVASRWEGIEVVNFRPLISAVKAERIAICGRGTIDGQGKAWWDYFNNLKTEKSDAAPSKWQTEFLKLNADVVKLTGYKGLQKGFQRPPLFQPMHCKNVLVEGVTVTNSPFWTLSPVYCENVTFHAVNVKNPHSPNTDGINPDSCRNVHISDCDISVGDDCITIKSGRDADGRRVGKPAENYVITNCTMQNGHGGVVVGSEMSGGVKNITISNCIFDGTDRGIRIKSARGRGGVIEDIRVSNIVMRGIREEAVILTTFYEKSDPEKLSERTPIFRNIRLSGLTGDAKIAGDFTGLTEAPLEGISLSDVRLDAEKGISMKDVKDMTLDHVIVNTKKGPAFAADQVEQLEFTAVGTTQPHEKEPVIELGGVKSVLIQNCRAFPGTSIFARVKSTSAKEVTLQGNQLSGVKETLAQTKE
jgi:hypothetical protein